MAFVPNQFLKETSNTVLRDQQHAARLFTDDQFRLAPKHKFLFHVAFSINQSTLQNIDLAQRHKNEINMLVKSTDLPSFTIQTETLNQYNRKKNIQYTHKYNPINMIFHDDNMGVINKLWQNYYNYYYADPSSAADSGAGAYDRNATRNFNHIINLYGLDNGSNAPFFNYIKIYQMARHEYVCYTLYNPIISSWNHNKVDYAQNAIHDNTMQIQYEAVSYATGIIADDPPEGFGVEHYDNTPSPVQGQASNISSSPSFTAGGNVTGNAGSFYSNAATAINSYQNTQELPQSSPNAGAMSNIIKTSSQGVSGVQGVAFPVSTNSNSGTTASIVKLG